MWYLISYIVLCDVLFSFRMYYCTPRSNKCDCVYGTVMSDNENTLLYSGCILLLFAIKAFGRRGHGSRTVPWTCD